VLGRRLLLLIDGLLLLAAAFLGARLHEAWWADPAPAPPEAAPVAVADPPAAPPALPDRPPLAAYGAVAERNLFSATRTEAAPEPPRPGGTAAATAPPAPRPRLYGVVLLSEGRGRAYLEDVQRRRVFAYSVGDVVGDFRLEQIKADRVVLRRGGETVEVLLYDPTKPRRAAAPPGVQSPEAGGSGRPTVARPPVPVPSPGGGPRAPSRSRAPAAPSPPPSTEGEESHEEE
jgi:hypothetical protein